MYVMFTVYPIFRQFEISFFNWHIFPGAANPFVGFSNFTQIFHDPVVRTAALNSFLYIVITVPVQMAIGLFAAAVLTDRLPGGMLWRAAVYIPVVTSWVVVSFIFAYIFSSEGRDHERRGWFFHRPYRDDPLDGADLDRQRRHLDHRDLEGCRLVVHHLPGRSRRRPPPVARVRPDRWRHRAPGLALCRPTRRYARRSFSCSSCW